MNYKTLGKFLTYKFIRLVILIIAVSIISFLLIDLSPIDPVRAYIGEMAVSAEQIAKLQAYWGVNEPLISKITNWVGNILQGDLGTSLIYRTPVVDVISERFTASLTLMFTSWVISGVLGFTLGTLAGMYRGTWIDKTVKGYCYILLAAPTFWIALLFLMVFSVYLGWFPTGLGVPVGKLAADVTIWEWLVRLILPAITLSLLGVAQIAMFTRDKLINVLSSDFVVFAKSRGESGWNLIKRHGIRNILLPAITLQFLSFSELFGGAVLVEQVFSYPGIGQAAVAAGLKSDVPLLLGIVLFSTIFVFCGNAIADLIYKFVDPRIKEGESYEQ
ncbi:ABC transporter permease [Methanobrevibacter sp. OttesenSCG-928-K11]|nr:ABC transporter permease [Methanobrevibacter sp. OttesenSCG-928-K11]MDL2271050.1 ABC transporter permease [Methanobrevibacter sp. OttesenSCG-928-I08]